MKINHLALVAVFMLAFANCKKNADQPATWLTSKIWKRALIDKDPSTNPQGANIYYAVQNCEKDDTFKFGTDGNLAINRGAQKCELNEQQNETQTYSVDRAKKELIINGVKFTLTEETTEQIKYYATVPFATGYQQLIFLLQ